MDERMKEMSWCSDLGALVCAAKDRDLSAADHESGINKAHEKLFARLRQLDAHNSAREVGE